MRTLEVKSEVLLMFCRKEMIRKDDKKDTYEWVGAGRLQQKLGRKRQTSSKSGRLITKTKLMCDHDVLNEDAGERIKPKESIHLDWLPSVQTDPSLFTDSERTHRHLAKSQLVTPDLVSLIGSSVPRNPRF